MTHIRWNLLIVLAALAAGCAQTAKPSALERQYRAEIEKLMPGMGAKEIPARKGPQQKLEKMCHEAGQPGKRADREALSKAIVGLAGADTPKPARVWLLRKIETLGDAEAVAGLAGLMHDADPEIADLARRALANNPSDKALAALRAELAKADKPEWKAALINALAWRHDEASAAAFAKLAPTADPVGAAAISALGEVTGDPAVKALAELRKSAAPDKQPAVVDASLRAAERLAAGKKTDAAKGIYEDLLVANRPENVRLAALTGLACLQGADAVPILLKYVTGADAHMQLAAARCLARVPEQKNVARQIAAALKDAAPPARALLVEVLGDRTDSQALLWVMQYMEDPDAGVRLAAYETMGKLGAAPTAHVLIAQGARSEGRQRDVIRKSVTALKGSDVDEEIVKILQAAKGPALTEAIMAVWGRRITAAKPTLLNMADDEDEAVRAAVLTALERIGDEADLPKLAELVAADRGEACAKAAEKAIASIGRRAGEPTKSVAPLIAAMPKATPGGQAAIINLLGKAQGDAALAAVRAAAKSDQAVVRDAAKAALADWRPVYITTWLATGPFRQEGKGPEELFTIAFPPEEAGTGVEWKPLKAGDPARLDLSQVDKGQDCCVYVKAVIQSERKQDVTLCIGSDDGVKAWLGGKVVHETNGTRALQCGQDKVKVTLEPGENPLLLKITQGAGQFEFCCAVQAAEGGPPDGLRFEAR